MLVDSSGYSVNFDTDEFIDDGPRANEVVGTNWAADGQVVTITVTLDSASDQIRWAVSDISVPTVTLTDADKVVIYVDSGSDPTSYLVAYGDFDTPLAPTAGTLNIDFDTVTWSLDYT